MKRYAICRMTGEGTFEFPLRPQAAEYFTNYSSVIGTDYYKDPLKEWIFLIVSTTQAHLDSLNANVPVKVFSFGPEHLDQLWSSLGDRSKDSRSIQALTRRLIPLDDGRTLRDVLEELCRIVEPTFDISMLDIKDVE